MPQLMPLMWISSTLMVSFILMVMVDMFFNSSMNNMQAKLYNEIVMHKNYLW